MRKLQSVLGQITGWCEMAGRWGRRNSWVRPPRSSWNMGPQIMWGRQSLSCSGWGFLSGQGRPKHVWLPPSHLHIYCLSLYTVVVALKSNTFKIQLCHSYGFGQSTNNSLLKLQMSWDINLLFSCHAWAGVLFYPKGGYYSTAKASMYHNYTFVSLECM